MIFLPSPSSPRRSSSRQAPLSGRIDPKIQADAERRNRLLEKEEKRYRILHKNWRRSDQAPPASVPTPLPTPSPSFQSKSPSAKKGILLEERGPHPTFEPTRTPSYRTPVKYLPLERDCRSPPEIDFIEPDPSPHAASVLFAPKPNTTARRFCIDYRWMNDHLKSRITPAPSLEGTAFGCREAQRFTKIDVIQAFHRLLLPFGLKVGPAWFQQFINAQLHDLLDRCASAYADDVLIYSDKEDHWKTVKKLTTSAFCLKPVWALVSTLGKFDRYKTGSLKTSETAPRSDHSLAYATSSVFSATPPGGRTLNRLLKKDVAFVMGPEQREAFDQLKRLAIEAPVLAFFRPELPTRLETDASRNATAGVLWQEQPDQTWKPVGFFSKTMTPAERAYPIQDRGSSPSYRV
ncbi:reverse transcriptase (RNA-dependent DNA polymerase) domain-containing protein [Hirsutella rhossiliensis]|uniref:Reverse transcriptase (RNA-dependent DNA polymerase) domain-containing protein n=1 Tax=Hirsutella rhossiliensis TaxID=111463 RepID=A0A9P8MSG7_9HYPO|nr:reverse transcriptase (RNA-dependent DNA polymerase) domain-containing protein [Hirsutella rhossiliensis]KAH0959396.1 reverse transcriptase (RNA-dependent DNA polymerase) domain-containing protein [Hirsutella rhossiliensis]